MGAGLIENKPSFYLVEVEVEVEAELGKNDLHAMKRILYDMGPLTLVRWPL